MTDTPPPPRRLPFNEALPEHAQAFAQYVLNEIPELEGIAIVFSYSLQGAAAGAELPYAVVLGQNEALKTPVEIMHMCQQLWRTLNFQVQNGYRCVQSLDGYMKERVDELKQLQDQINAAKAELESLRQAWEGTAQSGPAAAG